jgi:hypothetical protein
MPLSLRIAGERDVKTKVLWHDASMADLVRVWAGGDAIEGELLRARLEAEGIAVVLKGEGEGPYRAGPVYLFVDGDDDARARAILDAVASGAYALEEDADVEVGMNGAEVPAERD